MTKLSTSPLPEAPRPLADKAPGIRLSGLRPRTVQRLPGDPASRKPGPVLDARPRESFLTSREIVLTLLVLALLAAWVLEFAPMLHAVHAVRSAATVAATLAAGGSPKADGSALGWIEDLPGTGASQLAIHRYAGQDGQPGRVVAVATLDYYPSTPVVRDLLPRVIHLEAREERDMER